MTAFAARLKDSVNLDAVQADLASAVQRALEPAHVSLWMNNGRHAPESAAGIDVLAANWTMRGIGRCCCCQP